MIKGIIFDLDGTLLNTVDDIKRHLNKTLVEFGYNEVTSEEVKSFLGNGGKALVTKAVKDEIEEEKLLTMVTRYTKLYNDVNANTLTKPYDGIMALIKGLMSLGIKTAITSNKMQSGVTALNETVFDGLMDVAIGESEISPLKPNPQMVFNALNEMELTKEEVLFIGDTEVDLLTATNANIKSVAVSWGFRTKEFLTSLEPDYIIDEPSELLNIIKEINDNE